MKRAYKFKLEPTKEQIEKIEWTLDMCRWLYNSMLEQRKFAYKKRGITLTYNKQATELPALKKEIPEFNEIQSQVLQHVAKRLDLAFQGFFRRIRNGEKPGYPRFHGKNRFDSFTYPQSGFKIEGKFLKLSKIGNVRIKLHRQIEGKIKTCTIRRKNGKYYACIICEVEAKRAKTTEKQVGIDLGVKYLITTSDGHHEKNHKYLRKSERKIKYLQRMVSRRKWYICPAGETLTYRTTTREGYRQYISDPNICKDCPFLSQCTNSRNHTKQIHRHIWQDYLDEAEHLRHTEQNKQIYKQRKETIERVFAEMVCVGRRFEGSVVFRCRRCCFLLP